MRRETRNKYQGTRYNAIPKHKNTFAFHPGNKIPEVADRIPAYSSAGKTFKRILPPARDQRIINISLLCILLNRLVPQNEIELIPGGIKINQVDVKTAEGICSYKQMKFRFVDLKDLLINLTQEGILIANKLDLRGIKSKYFKALNEPDYE